MRFSSKMNYKFPIYSLSLTTSMLFNKIYFFFPKLQEKQRYIMKVELKICDTNIGVLKLYFGSQKQGRAVPLIFTLVKIFEFRFLEIHPFQDYCVIGNITGNNLWNIFVKEINPQQSCFLSPFLKITSKTPFK